MNNKFKKIIIATGGTGGHVFPAYSLAKHFLDNKINVEIISDKRGLRYLQDYHDIKVIEITSSTIFKKNIFQLLFSTLIIFYSIFRSFIFLLANRPNLVFGMGGYSSFPVCIAAKILRIPFIIYENNLHIGKANRYLLPYAKKVFVSHKELEGISEKYQKKICEIGNIIRKEILNFQVKSDSNQIIEEVVDVQNILLEVDDEGLEIMKDEIFEEEEEVIAEVNEEVTETEIPLTDIAQNKIEEKVISIEKDLEDDSVVKVEKDEKIILKEKDKRGDYYEIIVGAYSNGFSAWDRVNKLKNLGFES